MTIDCLSDFTGESQDFVVLCDSCEEARLECTTDGGFSAVTKIMKAQGWQYRKVKDEWLHFCPDCKIDFNDFTLKLYKDDGEEK